MTRLSAISLGLSARQIAERGARRIAAEQRARIAAMRQQGGVDQDELEDAIGAADLYEQLAKEFGAGQGYLPGNAQHRAAYRKGLV